MSTFTVQYVYVYRAIIYIIKLRRFMLQYHLVVELLRMVGNGKKSSGEGQRANQCEL